MSDTGQVTAFASHIIDKMHTGQTPAAISWLPATPAWYGLYGLIVLFITYQLLRRWYCWQTQLYLRQAQALITAYHQQQRHDQIGLVIKRVIAQHWPNTKAQFMTAGKLSGFLAEQGSPLPLPLLERLADAAYQRESRLTYHDINQLHTWVRKLC
ncbi:DUF4381 family protein [Vibrio sp. WXL103]|uniref:DUF4381 family protein n=1 Tax=Vibrio sp. WXL103 TaxID=3450710 RepID=UPI003EC8939E